MFFSLPVLLVFHPCPPPPHTHTQIVSSSYTAVAYLKSIGLRNKVFLIGFTGVEEELQLAGIPYVGGQRFQLPVYEDSDSMAALQVRGWL